MNATYDIARAVALDREGRGAEAVPIVEAAAAAGLSAAMVLRGSWRIEGRLMPRDLPGGRGDMVEAHRAGNAQATRILAGLLATGAGGERDWPGALALLKDAAARDDASAAQWEALSLMPLDAAGNPAGPLPAVEPISASPQIAMIRNFLTGSECGLLVALAGNRFRPATIFHEGRGAWMADPLRRSQSAGFPIVYEWPFVHAINRRIAGATGTAVEQGEPLQILHYERGEEYRPHMDAVPGLANQRAMTCLIWLNDDYVAGETLFDALPDSSLAVRGKTGDALIFANVNDDGAPDPRTRHAGDVVRGGVKLLASRWIRVDAFDPAEQIAG